MLVEHKATRLGQVVGHRYRLTSKLGSGGQATVFRATDIHSGDEVAIKIVDPDHLDPHWKERVFREAHALTVLAGTAAVRVLHQAWADDGAFCLVMELLQGVDLEAYLQTNESQGAQMNPSRLANMLRPLVETLEVAHHAGILHRDLKPSNIFILENGESRLLDFGFAKFTRMRPLTQAGMAAGSPSYIAPEIWQDQRVIDQRIDVYSLGAIMFRALTGSPPFVSANLSELLVMVTTKERPSLHALRPDLPIRVDDWVQHALAIAPRERFSGTRALYSAFTACFR